MLFKFNTIIEFNNDTDPEKIEELMDNIIAELWNNSKGVNITDYGKAKETE